MHNRFQIRNTAFEELLKVISIHLPVPNNFAGSMYKLKKIVSKVFPQVEVIKNKDCKVCLNGIQEGQGSCSICGNGNFSEFITTDLAYQLKQKFQGKLCVTYTLHVYFSVLKSVLTHPFCGRSPLLDNDTVTDKFQGWYNL